MEEPLGEGVESTRTRLLAWFNELAGAEETGGWGDCDYGIRGTDKRATDPTVRVCKRKAVASWVSPFTLPSLRELIKKAIVDADDGEVGAMAFLDCELLRYEVGGHFAVHVDAHLPDRPISETEEYVHLGTLLMAIPSADMEGGRLYVPHRLRRGDVFPKRLPHAVVLPLGIAHGVTPVKRGSRCVAKASIFTRVRIPTAAERKASQEGALEEKTD